jgi:hypothetical protein
MKDVAINEGRVIIKEIQDFFIRNRWNKVVLIERRVKIFGRNITKNFQFIQVGAFFFFFR